MTRPKPTSQLQKPVPSPSKIDFEIAKREFVAQQGETNEMKNKIEAKWVEPEEVAVSSVPKRTRRQRPTKSIIESGYFHFPFPRTVTDQQLYEEFKNEYIARGEEARITRNWRRRTNGPKVKYSS
jgi:hypothetical protein